MEKRRTWTEDASTGTALSGGGGGGGGTSVPIPHGIVSDRHTAMGLGANQMPYSPDGLTLAALALAASLAIVGGQLGIAVTYPGQASIHVVGPLASGSIVAGFGGGVFGGHVTFAPDNTYDIGASGATRPRTGYFGTSVVVGTDPGGTDALRVGGALNLNGDMEYSAAGGFAVKSTANNAGIVIAGATSNALGAALEFYGGTHATLAGRGYITYGANTDLTGTLLIIRRRNLAGLQSALTLGYDLSATFGGNVTAGANSVTGGTVVGTTRVTSPLHGTTTDVNVVFDRNSVTQLTLGSLTATFAGVVGIAGAASAARGINCNPSTLTGTLQYGAVISVTSSASATSAGYGAYIACATAAAAYTQANLYGIYIEASSIGAGSTVAAVYGLRIGAQSGGASINRAIHTAGGDHYFSGPVIFPDNTYDIGASGATRPRTGYFGTSVVAPLFQGTTLQSGAAADLLLKYNTTTVLTISSALVTCAQDFTVASGKVYKVNSVQVIGAQGAAVADATDAASAITQLNAWLARARAHGLIASA